MQKLHLRNREICSDNWGQLFLHWNQVDNINDSSIVMFYQYADTLVVFPGDIEEKGWIVLYPSIRNRIDSMIAGSTFRILVAPHHGRGSGYSQRMMETLSPHLVIVSDEHGRAPTDRRFREVPLGIRIDGILTKYISTKSNSRVLLVVGAEGLKVVNAN